MANCIKPLSSQQIQRIHINRDVVIRRRAAVGVAGVAQGVLQDTRASGGLQDRAVAEVALHTLDERRVRSQNVDPVAALC